MWTYEGYWAVVMGANRSAADTVREFGLVTDGLEQWVDSAAAEAASMGGLPVRETVEEWADAGHLDRMVRELEKAIEG